MPVRQEDIDFEVIMEILDKIQTKLRPAQKVGLLTKVLDIYGTLGVSGSEFLTALMSEDGGGDNTQPLAS